MITIAAMVEDIPLVGLAPANWFYPGQESAMSGQMDWVRTQQY